jgi:hypothetical protein
MKKIAFYLPQFHQEKLNESIWGINFTDWITSQNSTPLFKGHVQPKRPVEEPYDLLDINVLENHCKQAKTLGLDGFSFYFYSFDKNLSALRKPIDNYLASDIDFPFCITWANHSWTKAWIGQPNIVIAAQKYDNEQISIFCDEIIPFLEDPRYIKINDRPILVILNTKFLDLEFLKKCIKEKSLNKIDPFIITTLDNKYRSPLIDLYIGWPPGDVGLFNMQSFPVLKMILRKLRINKYIFKYTNVGSELKFLKRQVQSQLNLSKQINYSQTILTGWDNTPRYGINGYLLDSCSSTEYINFNRNILSYNIANKSPVTFIKAWNEWAEGNVIELKVNDTDYNHLIKEVLDQNYE